MTVTIQRRISYTRLDGTRTWTALNARHVIRAWTWGPFYAALLEADTRVVLVVGRLKGQRLHGVHAQEIDAHEQQFFVKGMAAGGASPQPMADPGQLELFQ